MSGSVYTRKTHLSHTTPRLILIRVGIDHKGDKALSHNTTVFPRLELETPGLDRRDHNHFTYMFGDIRQELLNKIDFKFNYQCLILGVY